MKKPKNATTSPPIRSSAAPGARTANLAVRVSDELLAALSRVAAAEERTKSQMAEIILRRWLQERGELK
jgi:hypothetical protein